MKLPQQQGYYEVDTSEYTQVTKHTGASHCVQTTMALSMELWIILN